MDLFTEIADAQVILRTRGVFKQTKLYARGDQLFAAAVGGYVRLLSAGSTSVPSILWLGISVGDDAILPGRETPTRGML